MKDVVYICSGILLSHQNNEILPFLTMWMELKCIMLSKMSLRTTNTMILFMWNLRNKAHGRMGKGEK